jgi:hypothetical protein
MLCVRHRAADSCILQEERKPPAASWPGSPISVRRQWTRLYTFGKTIDA